MRKLLLYIVLKKINYLGTLWEGQVLYVHGVIILLNYASNLTTSNRGYGLPMYLVKVRIIGVVFLHSTAFNVNCELFL